MIKRPKTRVCVDCNKRYPYSTKHFYMMNKETNQLSVRCKKCAAIRSRTGHKVRIEWLFDYLKDKSCEHCGETNPIVLDFHHKDPKTKSHNVSNLIASNTPITKIESEIAKCMILCKNCHYMHHAKEDGWGIYKLYLDSQ